MMGSNPYLFVPECRDAQFVVNEIWDCQASTRSRVRYMRVEYVRNLVIFAQTSNAKTAFTKSPYFAFGDFAPALA